MQEQQAGCVIELGDRAWTEDRFYVEDPVELQALARVFPDGQERPFATHPVDLDLLNFLARPLGFLATWEPGGLLIFRIHL